MGTGSREAKRALSTYATSRLWVAADRAASIARSLARPPERSLARPALGQRAAVATQECEGRHRDVCGLEGCLAANCEIIRRYRSGEKYRTVSRQRRLIRAAAAAERSGLPSRLLAIHRSHIERAPDRFVVIARCWRAISQDGHIG
jgi:hypothetical protein